MAVNNSTIMARAWLNGTNDYQQRVPGPTQASIKQSIDALFDPMNTMYYNQFIDYLVNRIGWTIVRQQSYENPLAVFKGNKINYGSTIQEIAPKWIKAHSYRDDDETLLRLRRPDAQVWYHTQNRRDQYAISVVREELQTAFVDEFGLNNLIAGIMQAPVNSDNYDEFNIMKNLMAVYDGKWGFYRHHLSAVPTDEATGKELLTALQTYGGLLQFPSTLYTGTDIPVFAKPDELVLIVTPATQAALNVQTLAALFNVDLAKVQYRTVLIDEFPIPDAVALLTTEDFFVCHDTVYNTGSFYNPQTMANNYFLNHFGIYSVSPFVPAILFTTDEGTENRVITQTVQNLTVTPEAATVEAGGSVQLDIDLKGTVNGVETGEDIAVRPDACTFTVSAEIPAGDPPAEHPAVPVELNSRTRVDQYGVLHVQRSGLPAGTVFTVNAVSTYRNPSGEYTEKTATAKVSLA